MKKIISFLFIFVLLFGCGVTAFAADDVVYMSYNGVKLPCIPESDLPFVSIIYNDYVGGYEVRFSSLFYCCNLDSDSFYFSGDGYYDSYVCYDGTDEWVAYSLNR